MSNLTTLIGKQKNSKVPRKHKILIIGSSGHAKVIIDIFEKSNWEVIGLIDDFRNKDEKTMGYKILGKVDDIPQIINDTKIDHVFVAIGDNWDRHNIVNKIRDKNPRIKFANAIHPTAKIGKNVRLGKGIAIMAGAIVNADAKIGNFAFINTKASAGHDVRMMDYSSLAPGVTVGGNTKIGECSAISIGAIIKDKIKIGKHCVVGAGALLLKNCEDNWIIYGAPAKEIRKREIGEKYL